MRGLVSVRTSSVAAFGAAATVASQLVVANSTVDGVTSPIIANAPSIIINGVAVAVMLWAVSRLGLHEPVGRQWAWITAGCAAFFVGNIVWTFYEVVLQQAAPFPGAADLFYLLLYPLAATGLFMAVAAFRRIFDLRLPLAVSAAVCVVASVALYFAVFRTIAGDQTNSPLAKLVSFFYPLGDVWLLLFPAIALALTARRLAGGRLSWPWWITVAGFLFVSAADVLFTIGTWDGSYQSGSIVDAGWWLGFSLVAVAASLMVDVQKPRASGAEVAS